MEFIDGGQVFVFPKLHERPHAPGPEEFWQESFVIIWYDPRQAVGGFFRLAHEPNCQGGQSQIICNIFSPEGVYRRTGFHPIQARHRLENGYVSGDDSLRYMYDEGMRWWFRDSGIEMDIEVDDFVPAVDIHRNGAPDSSSHGAQVYLGAHVDAGCSVTGTLKVKGRTYQIKDALAVRDHAWGPRAWTALLAHRWIVATFDRENSLVAMSFLTTGNPLAKYGWVIRGDKVIRAEKIDIRAIIGMDGATNLGGTLRMTLTTGEVLEAKYEPYYPCIALCVRNNAVYDSISRVTWGDKVGFGVFETSSNTQAGTREPEYFEGSYTADAAGKWHEAKILIASR
jgi:hypothetical protein